MTPSINRLASAAVTLGEYIMESEWSLVSENFGVFLDLQGDKVWGFDEFSTWIKGWMYYEAVVCATTGNIDRINSQLKSDLEELLEEHGLAAQKVG